MYGMPYGMNPMYLGGPYGGPTGGMYAGPTGGMYAGATGMAPSTGSNNPFNPFAQPAAPQGPLSAVRLTDDPLNSLTEDLLGAK